MHYNQVQAKGTFAKMKDERWSFVFELVFILKVLVYGRYCKRNRE